MSVLRLVVFLLLGLFVHSISDIAYPSIILSILAISESFSYIRCIRFFLFFRLPILSTASISIWVRRLSSPTFIIIDSSSSTNVVLSSFPLSSTSLPLVDYFTLALFILCIMVVLFKSAFSFIRFGESVCCNHATRITRIRVTKEETFTL